MGSIKLETTGKKHTSKKSLDTLVPDINKLLVNLTYKKKVPVTEEQISRFLNNIKEVIMDFTSPMKADKGVLRMSILGRPARQLWYDRAGHEVTDQQKKVTVDGIVGHMDSKIDGEVVDVKTASSHGFRKFKDGTLYEDDPFGYVAQLSGYEENEPTNKGGFLALNKATGELALFRPDDLMKPNVSVLIKDVKEKLAKDTPPDKCYQPIPHEKGGNMKLPMGCFFCNHKVECHADTNEGKGLRLFQYAKSKVYMTKVMKEPKVEELAVE